MKSIVKKAAKKTKPYIVTRRQHSVESAEDYTELVAELIEKNGEARTCSIAEHLGVSHVTALRTIKRLQTSGYLTTSRNKPVLLTKQGHKLAQAAKERHTLLVNFFVALGVSREQAEEDVEGAEHHISLMTLNCIKKFMLRNNS